MEPLSLLKVAAGLTSVSCGKWCMSQDNCHRPVKIISIGSSRVTSHFVVLLVWLVSFWHSWRQLVPHSSYLHMQLRQDQAKISWCQRQLPNAAPLYWMMCQLLLLLPPMYQLGTHRLSTFPLSSCPLISFPIQREEGEGGGAKLGELLPKTIASGGFMDGSALG